MEPMQLDPSRAGTVAAATPTSVPAATWGGCVALSSASIAYTSTASATLRAAYPSTALAPAPMPDSSGKFRR